MKLFFSGLLALCCVPAVVAQEAVDTERREAERAYVRDQLAKNWYVEAGAGAQILFADDASGLGFGQRLTPSLSVAAGKWFSPYWGMRLQARGYGFNGNTGMGGIYVADPVDGLVYGTGDPVRSEVTIRPDGTYRRYMRYLDVHVDFRLRLLDLIGGPGGAGRWEVMPAVGLGYARAFAYRGVPAGNFLATHFSLAGSYRLAPSFDLNLEAHAVLLPDAFDGRITGQPCEAGLALTLGATYHFPARGFRRTAATPPPALEALAAPAPAEVRVVRDTVVLTREVRVEVSVEVANEPFTLGVVAFAIDSSEPRPGQEVTYVNLARYLEAHPRAMLRLDGYADAATGTPEYNLHLSRQRADAVYRLLTEQYGIAPGRLQAQGIGGNGTPYDQAAWNRAVVVTVIEE